MRFEITAALATLAAIPLASAHYTFSGLVVNGKMVGRDWQYIRQHTRGYMPTFKEEAATSNEFRCNTGAASGAKTDVYTVKPGDKVGLRQAFGAGGMKHPGPVQIYMSPAPGSVKTYDGSGDWIKVYQDILCKNNLVARDLQYDAWCMYGEETMTFEIPATVPNGEYLVRGEHIALHGAHDGKAEMYYACAQIKVEGSTATTLPGPKTKIPGVYKTNDAPINFSVWGGKTVYPVTPGIAVAPGGQIRGSIDGRSAATITVSGGSEAPAPVPAPVPSNVATSSSSAAPAPQPTSTFVTRVRSSSSAAAVPTTTAAAVPTTSAVVVPTSSAEVVPTSTIVPEAVPTATPTKKSCRARRRAVRA